MDAPTTEQRIKRLLVSRLKLRPELVGQIAADTPLLGRGVGLDSMETMVLVAAIEDEFDIVIDDDDLTAALFADLATLVRYVERHVLDREAHVGGSQTP